MITLYVREQGAGVRRTGQRLIVFKGQQALQTARLRDLERVVLFGRVEMTSSASAALLDNGIETILLSYGGKLRGRLAPADAKNVFLRQTQFRRYDDMEFRVRIGSAIVDGKVRNARSLLQHYAWNHPSTDLKAAIEKLQVARERVARQTSIDALLGAEGDAASVYFAALGKMMRTDFVFKTRTRRPPRDPVNALLSFAYTLLSTEMTGALAAQGLDPHVGVLHDLDYGRPSLALDLLEEFRQPVADRLAVSLVNRNVLSRTHFDDRGESGVLLNDIGRSRFLEFYHKALETEFQIAGPKGERSCFREIFRRQARLLRKTIEDGTDYIPFSAR